MKMLMEDLKNHQFKKIYLLTGEEVYLRNQYKNRLRDALLPSEDTMNLATFEGKGINPKEIIDLAETMPFFADRRVILIEDSGFAKNACPELADYVPDMPDSTCIILVEAEVDKRGRLYKAIKKAGRVVEFERQDERTLSRWVFRMLEQEEKILNTDTLHFFLERTGSDMEHIYLEVQKLISYTHGRNVITPADVEAICTEQTENRIFDMVQAITEKDQKKALDLYSDLLAMKEPPMRILFLIARQFNQLLQLKSLSSQGMDRASLAKAAGIPSFALGKYQAQCRRFTLAQLRQAVEDCVQSEENVKTGRMGDQISVELLIMKYSSL